MKTIKDYVIKLKFVFNEILKADPSIFFLSISSMVIAGISPVVVTYLTAELIDKLGKILKPYILLWAEFLQRYFY